MKGVGELLRRTPVGRLGLSFKDEPYVIPLNFLYTGGKIYFHTSQSGRKIEYLMANSRVCFEVDEFLGIEEGKTPCSCSTYYRSVIATGEAKIISKFDEKREILRKLLRKYTKRPYRIDLEKEKIDRTNIIEVSIKEVTGKERLPPIRKMGL